MWACIGLYFDDGLSFSVYFYSYFYLEKGRKGE